MAGPNNNDPPPTDSDKLDRILAQLTTINKRLDSHDLWLARMEKAKLSGDYDVLTTEELDTDSSKRGGSGYNRFDHQDRRGHDDWRRPHRPKLNFPHYDGESDPLPWLNKCESYFRGCRTMDEEKVWLASLHLDGVAAEWYYQLEREAGIVSWPRFADYVNLRFGPPIRSNALGELKDLRRSGSVEDYQRHFLELLCRCEGLTMRHQVDLFTEGLGQPLASDVEMQRPANLQTAMSLARDEKRSAEAARAVIPAASRTAPRPRHTAPTTQASASAPAATERPDDQRPRFRRLSPDEIAEKRLNGQCYFCPEKFTRDHKCARKGVFLLELDEDEYSSDADDTVSISLHALTGLTAADTMQLHVRIAGVDLVALVDTSSTHNFINSDITSRLGLHVMPRPGLSVKVANGERVPSGGLCTAINLSIKGERFTLDCYALQLDSFDMVLVRWLRTLGPIIWDFKNLSMQFWRDGRTLHWTGIGRPSPPVLAFAWGHDDVLGTLLAAYSDIFTEPRGLPPQRQHDHRIHLLPGTAPVAVDWVWLRLQHRTAVGIASSSSKLAPRFYGPFQIDARIGDVAYRLRLPDKARIHNVFHVGLLKKLVGDPPAEVPVPLPPILHGRVIPTPSKVLRARLNRGLWELLVLWEGRAASDATWEPLSTFATDYPDFHLEDELFLREGGNVMDSFVGRVYRRRSKAGQQQRVLTAAANQAQE